MESALKLGDVLHGYRLVRVIGEGGFGRVWLCVSEVLDKDFALKEIRGVAEASEREFKAVQKFKQLNLGSGSGMMPIEHVGRINGLLYYVMPLADGDKDVDPKSTEWQPLTLGLRIRKQKAEASWFSPEQITSWLATTIHAAAAINKAGLVHRDIKPENIIFVGGNPVLSDISLLREDGAMGTFTGGIGTPGYRSPKWYVESGGNPDMYGLAVTLYVALTGNDPDTLGKSPEKYWWPPHGKKRLSPEHVAEWERLHKVILRATSDDALMRFSSFIALTAALKYPSAPPFSKAIRFIELLFHKYRRVTERLLWRILSADVRRVCMRLWNSEQVRKSWYVIWLVPCGLLGAFSAICAPHFFLFDQKDAVWNGRFYVILAVMSAPIFIKCYSKLSLKDSSSFPRLSRLLPTYYKFTAGKPPPGLILHGS